MLEDLWQDLRYAVRDIRGNPGFIAVAVLSLALGIGANTAIFSLIDAVMLRSLPVSHPEELIQLTMGKQAYAEGYMNPVWEQVRDRQDVFLGVFAYGGGLFASSPGVRPKPDDCASRRMKSVNHLKSRSRMVDSVVVARKLWRYAHA